MPLRPVEHLAVERVDKEQRPAHLIAAPRAARRWLRPGTEPMARCARSLSVERVADPREEAALLRQLRDLLAAGLGEIAQDPLLIGIQLGRRTDVEVHEQVAASGTAQVRYPLAADAQRRVGLGTGAALDGLFAVERLDGQPG